jgi:hypothetical protein
MSMRMLLDGEFDQYFDPDRTKGATWVFQHVPKTAGSSLRAELLRVFREPDEETNIHIDGTDPAIPFHARLDAAVEAFIARASARPYRFVSGHIFERHVARLRAAVPTARVLTFLRDPVARVMSDYRYQRSALHPDHLAFRAAVPTITDYLGQAGESEKMARYLLPRPMFLDGDAERGFAHLVDNFEFVGLQDEYEASFRALGQLLALPSQAVAAERRNPPTPDNPMLLDDGVAGSIAAHNKLDVAILKAFRDRLDQVRQPLAAWIGKRAPPHEPSLP